MESHLTNLTVDCDSRVFSYRNRQIPLIRVLRIFRNLKKYVLVRTYLISKVMTLSFSVLSEGIFLLSHLYLQILERDNKFSLIHKIYRLPFPLSTSKYDRGIYSSQVQSVCHPPFRIKIIIKSKIKKNVISNLISIYNFDLCYSR